jgi:hypothetical protein
MLTPERLKELADTKAVCMAKVTNALFSVTEDGDDNPESNKWMDGGKGYLFFVITNDTVQLLDGTLIKVHIKTLEPFRCGNYRIAKEVKKFLGIPYKTITKKEIEWRNYKAGDTILCQIDNDADSVLNASVLYGKTEEEFMKERGLKKNESV